MPGTVQPADQAREIDRLVPRIAFVRAQAFDETAQPEALEIDRVRRISCLGLVDHVHWTLSP